MIIHICPNCQEEYKAKHSIQKFCSRACKNTFVFKGKKYSDERIVKMKTALKGINAGEKNHFFGLKGELSPVFGYKHTEEHKQKLSALKKGKYLLEDNPNWKGGKSFELYPQTWNKELKTAIRQRDGFTCQLCGENGFDVHHKDYDKNNCSPDNLITLCRKCHPKTNHNREKWIEFFGVKQAVNQGIPVQ